MRNNQKLIDDLMALGSNVIGNVLGARHEIRAQAKQRMGGLAQHLNFVSREEFDAAFAMLSKARLMQEDLNERLEKVEALLNVSSVSKNKFTKNRRLPSVKKGNQKPKRK